MNPPVSELEVKVAMFYMAGDKAPDPDGLLATFYQKNWVVVGKDVVKFVQKAFETGEFLKGMNETSIVLISK